MSGSESIDNASEELQAIRRETIDRIKNSRQITTDPNSLTLASDAIRPDVNLALSETVARLDEARRIIQNTNYLRIEDGLRRLSYDQDEIEENEISILEKRVISAEERRQKIDMETRLASQERKFRDLLDMERKRISSTLSSDIRERVSKVIEKEFNQRLDAMKNRMEIEQKSEIRRLERRLEAEFYDLYSKSSDIKIDAKRVELQSEMRNRLHSFRIRREAELEKEIEDRRRRTQRDNELALRGEIKSLEADAQQEIDEELQLWYEAEMKSMGKIEIMKKREIFLTKAAEMERRIEDLRSRKISKLREKIRKVTKVSHHGFNVKKIENEIINEWDRISDKILDGLDLDHP